MEQTVTPYLLYEDGAAANAILTDGFGFREKKRTAGDGRPEAERVGCPRGQVDIVLRFMNAAEHED